MKYVHYDKNTGKILGFFDNEIHPAIPEPNFEISVEQWEEALEKGYNCVDANNKTLFYKDFRTLDEQKSSLYDAIQSLADTKTKELKNYIAGKRVTPEQVDRYEQKYQLALKCKEAGDYTPLNLEAELQGITGEELADLIITKHDEWVAKLQKYTALIEAYRVKAQTIVESLETIEDVEKAKGLLERAKEFGIDTTEEQIKELFEEFEGGA